MLSISSASPAPRSWRSVSRLAPALLAAVGLVTGLLLLLADPAQAAPRAAFDDGVLYVSPTGTGTTCARTLVAAVPPAAAYYSYAPCSLTYALSIAEPGNTLLLAQGDYVQGITITNSLTIRAGFPITFADGTDDPVADPVARQTRLIAPGGAPAITVLAATTNSVTNTVTIHGLRVFHNGPSATGPGLSVTLPITLPNLTGAAVHLNLVQAWVQNHVNTGANGGGLVIHPAISARVGITHTEFSGNQAAAGGAIWLSPQSTLVGSGAKFLNNQATGGSGGALYATLNTVAVTDVTFTGNQATGSGGAIYGVDTGLTLNGAIASSFAGVNGGGIYLTATVGVPLTAPSLTLSGNTAGGSGGALYAHNATVSIGSGSVAGNQTTGGSGGGLYLSGGSAMLGALPITNNRAATHGGGIYRINGDLTLSGNQIMTNTATGRGGGIALDGPVGTAMLTGITWRNNQAGQAGGAAYLAGTQATVTGSPLIVNNRAANGAGLYVAVSGAATLTHNAQVRQNSATAAGGGIYVLAASATITGNHFLTNTAGAGGGLYLTGTVSAGDFSSNTIQGNRATGNGGGLAVFNSQITLGALTLTRNEAANGGALFAHNSRISDRGSGGITVVRNSATGSGGGLYLTGGAALTTTTLSLITNTATLRGGGLYAEGAQLAVTGATTAISNTAKTGQGGALYLSNSTGTLGALTLTRNRAQGDGGALYAAHSTLTATSLTATNNTAATGSGGAIFGQGMSLTLTGGLTLHFNRAQTHGGALYAGSAGQMEIRGPTSLFSNTVTTGSGGALYLHAGMSLTATGSLSASQNIAQVSGGVAFADHGSLTASFSLVGGGTVRDNRATTGSGGAFYLSNRVDGTFGSLILQNNRAQAHGGALAATAAAFRFNAPVTISANTAITGDGGGLYLNNGMVTFVNQAIITANVAGSDGGGIYAQDIEPLALGAGSQVNDNVAQTGNGGGIYAGGGELTTGQVYILRNTAQVDGGGLYAPGGNLMLAGGSQVRENKALTRNGGGIYAGGGTVILTHVKLEANTTKQFGGGLYLTGAGASTLRVEAGSSVSSNRAETAQGGGIFITGTGAPAVTLDASTLAHNTAATGGGGLYQQGGTLTVTHASEIRANTTLTGSSGGGLAVITGTVVISTSTLAANRAGIDGGGLYAPGGEVRIVDSTIDANTLETGRGAGLYVDGASLTVTGSSFNGNVAAQGGGGIYAHTLYVHISTSELTTNNGGQGPGGAAYLSADLVDLLANRVDRNETAGNGGGLAVEDTAASTVISNTLSNNQVRRDVTLHSHVLTEDVVVQQTGTVIAKKGDVITGEKATEGSGAGLYFLRSRGLFVGNSIEGNENKAAEGGGIFASSSAMSMTNNLVVGNSVVITTAYAPGIYVNNGVYDLRHTTIADNVHGAVEPGATGVGLYVTKSSTDTTTSTRVVMVNNIIAGHQVGMMLLTGATAALKNNLFFNASGDWEGSGAYQPSTGNRVGDPLFVDAARGDYHIQRKSAAFDMGTPEAGVTHDISGTIRPRAFGVDAGAFEHRYPAGVHMQVTATPAFVGSGETIEYKVKVVNHSLTPLSGVRLNFGLPSQQTAVGASGAACAGTTCSLGNLAVDQQVEVTLRTRASGTPPAGGFIEMVTNVTVSSGSFVGGSDTTEALTTRLQVCRIMYQGVTYPSLQAAVAAVNDFDEIPDTIRVAGYCGGSTLLNNKKVTIQGGWNLSMDTLNPAAFPTTIDAGGTGRVFRIQGDATPIIENLTLRGGNASGQGGGPAGKDAGGNIYITSARATLRNVRLDGGRAAFGANLYVDHLTAPIIENSIIENGRAWERGGGVYANNGSPEIRNTTLRNNSAKAGGGAYFYKGEAKVQGSTIAGNQATGEGFYLEVAGFNIRFAVGGGGGINFDESKASITTSTLENNRAKAGGAIFADNSPGTVSSSLLRNNEADGANVVIPVVVLANKPGGGGAIYAQRSDMVIEYNRIVNNRATSAPGGAIHIFNSSADGKLNGNYLGYNSASKGSAVYVHLKPDTMKIFLVPLIIPDFLLPLILGKPQPDPPKLTLINNTVAHNGGSSAVHFYGESYGELVGNIFAFNTGAAVKAETQALPYIVLIPVPIIFILPLPFPVFYVPKATVDYTLWFHNGADAVASGVGAEVSNNNGITSDPHFKNDGFHIKRISAAYNTGKNTGIPVDLDGTSRPQADITDLGADEYPAQGVRYVAPGGPDAGANFCRDYLNPCGSLQVAIDSAQDGDLIKMAGGTYTGVGNRLGQVQMGFITKTLTIQGGYYRYTTDNNVTEGNFTDHDWEVPFPDLNPTVLDAGGLGRHFYILDPKRVDDEGKPIKVEPVLSGLTLRNGNSAGLRGPQGNAFDAGGSIYIDNTTASVINVDIRDSVADYGGGIYLISANVVLSDVVVVNNRALERGGGFYLDNSDKVQIRGITIEQNKAPRGGGFYLDNSDALLQQNQILNNGDAAATRAGGGIFLDNSTANVISNTISANNAVNGGGLFGEGGSANITGNTFANNRASSPGLNAGFGGGCYLGTGTPNVTHNTFQGNQAVYGAGCFLEESGANVNDNLFNANQASAGGGGLQLRNSSAANLQRNTLTGNIATLTGGGMGLEASSAVVRANQFSGNRAESGGGAFLDSFSNATLELNVVTANTALRDGGGLYLKLSNANLTNNRITANVSGQGNGGGVYVKLSGARFTENTVEENTANLGGGGGFYLDESAAALIQDSVRRNTARDGGGIYLFRSNAARFDQVGIENNQATQFGGGIYVRLSDVPIEDQQILSNRAQVAGGGVFVDASAVSFNRNLLRDNQAAAQGGGIAITRGSRASLHSNAIIDNQAGTTGSGVYVAGSQPTLIHTTIARNQGGDGTGVSVASQDGAAGNVKLVNTILANQNLAVKATTGSTVTLEATLWDSNGTNFQPNAGAILTGPAHLNFFGAALFDADGYHLSNNSKAIGVGVVAGGRDIDGDGRPQGGGPELGADELVANCAAVASNNLTVVYTSVQEAIDATPPGGETRIAGTCVGANTRDGTRQLAYINKQITVRGGYTPTNWLVSYPISQPTFLDAQGLGRVLLVASGANPTLEHLNLANGAADNLGGGPGGLDAGGAIYIRNANPILRNLTLVGGQAYYGGLVYVQNSTTTISDSTLEGGAGTKGGGIFLRNANVTLRNNTIRSSGAQDGGGLFLSFSQPLLENNRIEQNSATAAGGGIFLESSSALLRGNLVMTNTAQAAGGIYVDGAAAQILRNIIGGNTGQNAGGLYLSNATARVDGNQIVANNAGIGGGLYVQGGQPILDNNVIAKNVGQLQASGMYVLSSSPPLRHNTWASNQGGDGTNILITDLGLTPANIDMVNNILVNHGTAISLTTGNKITLRNLLLNNNKLDYGGPGIVDNKGGHVVADPLFIAANTDDYHLQPASPARDKGLAGTGVTIDMDGQARPADNGFDIGADEFVFTGVQLFVQTVPDPVVAGAPFNLVVRVDNIGNVDQTAAVTLTLPAEMSPTGVLTFTPLIRRGETWVQTLNAQIVGTFAGTLKVQAHVTTSADTDETIEATVTVARPDFALGLVAEAQPSPVPPGSQISYQIRLTNLGNQPILPHVEAILPAPVTAAAPLQFEPGELGPAGAWTKTFVAEVAPNATGNLVAIFRATSNQGPSAVYTLTVPVAQPNIVTTVAATPDPVVAGQTVTFTLRVQNTGNIDFTSAITFVAPLAGNGRPLVAPGSNQFFSGVDLKAGSTWEQVLVLTVEPGYTGPLNSQVQVGTQTGLLFVHNDSRQVVLPARRPTKVAIRSGAWDDPNTWDPAGVPSATDIVLIPADITLSVAGGTTNPLALTGLINRGTILLNCIIGTPMQLEVSDFIDNSGLIAGRDGQAMGEPGCAVTVRTRELNNPGVIRAGNGADGGLLPPDNTLVSGGDGGAINVFVQTLINNGQILGGSGGNVPAPAAGGDGGTGGDALVVAGPPTPALLLTRGLIAAGSGGNANQGRGGAGGSIGLLSATQLTVDGGETRAGSGGNPGGSAGGVSMTAETLWENGQTRVNTQAYGFTTQAVTLVRGIAGAVVSVPVHFLNSGRRADTYLLIWTNSAGWVQPALPSTFRVPGLRFDVLIAPFTIPNDARVGDTSQVRMEARSQGDPSQVHEQVVRVRVVSGGRVYLPNLHKDNVQAQSSDVPALPDAQPPTVEPAPVELAPAQPAPEDDAAITPAPTSGDQTTYLPLVPLTPTDTP